MALTFTKVDSYVAGDRQVRIYDVTLDASYAVGGYAIAPASLGFRTRITHLSPDVAKPAGGATSFPVSWDGTNKKLQVYFGNTAVSTPLKEVGVNNTNGQSGAVVRVVAVGK